MAQVSFSLSAASAATANVAPRPMTKADFAPATRSTSGARRRRMRGAEQRRQFRDGVRKRSLASPFSKKRRARHQRGDHRLGRRDGFLDARMQRQQTFRATGDGRIDVVDQRQRQCAGAPGGGLQGDDIGAAARLGNRHRERPFEAQRRIIERGDGGTDRGAGNAKRDLDEIFQIERGMIRTASRNGRDDARRARAATRRRDLA